MKREIKFRAWCKEDKEMWNSFYFNESVDVNDNFEDDRELVYEQFTGLKDKNGKEIFESDIVNHSDESNFVFQVEYTLCDFNNGFHAYRIGDTGAVGIINFPINEYNKNEIEIIGNIHESPELLDVKDA